MSEKLYTKMSKDNLGNFKGWYKNENCTILHRSDGPAKEYTNGGWCWYNNGKKHRKFAPVEYLVHAYNYQSTYYWIDNQIHRYDGPAHTTSGGTNEWHIKGEKIKKEEFDRANYILDMKSNSFNLIKCLVNRIFRQKEEEFKEEDFGDFKFSKIDHNSNGFLYSTDDLIPFRFLYLKDCSTSKPTLLRVPPDIESVQEGLDWSFSQNNNEYKPEIQT